MKKTILLIAVSAIMAATVNATQWSVSNSPFNPGQFNSLGNALASALVLNGDTLLLHPTVQSYGTITLSKSIVFIGGGFNTQKSGVAQQAIIDDIVFFSPASVSGTKFYGLRLNRIFAVSGSGPLNNITFEDCQIDNQIYIPTASIVPVNMVIRNCIFMRNNGYNIELAQSAPTASSIVVTNSMFRNGFTNNRGILIVKNCVFFISSFNSVENATFENCIITTLAVTGLTNCVFNNCISGVSALPPAGNSGSGNLAPAAVVFVNAPSNTINVTYDYHLTPASAGYTGGTDGQQLGVFGGTSTFSLTGEPLNSAITRNFVITNSVIPVNGTLNINATVTAPNKQ